MHYPFVQDISPNSLNSLNAMECEGRALRIGSPNRGFHWAGFGTQKPAKPALLSFVTQTINQKET